MFVTANPSYDRNITMTDAENGARIKAFAGSGVGSGIVKNITFEHFFETKVDNPIVIDQASELLVQTERHIQSIHPAY